MMNRDEGINNLSHVYDPVIQEEVNIKKTFAPEVVEIFSATQQLDHNNNSPDEADCSSLRNCRQKKKQTNKQNKTKKTLVFNWS